MIEVKQIGDIAQSHNAVVFVDETACRKADMRNAIGRFDRDSQTMQLIDNPIATKYKSNVEAGWKINLIEDKRGNFYVVEPSAVAGGMNESILPEFVEYVCEQDFVMNLVENKSDSIVDLTYKNDHVVGYVNTHGSYTLRPEIAELLNSDFEIEQQTDDEDIWFNIIPTTISSEETVRLNRFLKREEWADEINEAKTLNEAIDKIVPVHVPSLKQVQSLLANAQLCLKHGLHNEVKPYITDLNEIIEQYENAKPKGEGLDEVRDAISELSINEPIKESAEYDLFIAACLNAVNDRSAQATGVI